MVYCCAFGCKNRESAELRLTRGITFHRFPDPSRSPERHKQWTVNVRRDGFVPGRSTRICSDHFTEDMMDRTGQITRLRPSAVPTQFKFSSQSRRTRKSLKKQDCPVTSVSQPSSSESSAIQDVTVSHVHCSVKTWVNDHSYAILQNSQKLNNASYAAIDEEEGYAYRQNLKEGKKRSPRLRQNVDSLQTVVSSLKDKHLVSDECADLLETTFSGVSEDSMKRVLCQKRKKEPGAYTAELRSFAMVLHCYSVKAYSYVRQRFDLGLPHSSVIRKWYRAQSETLPQEFF